MVLSRCRIARRLRGVAKACAVGRFGRDLFTVRSAILWAQMQPLSFNRRELRSSLFRTSDRQQHRNTKCRDRPATDWRFSPHPPSLTFGGDGVERSSSSAADRAEDLDTYRQPQRAGEAPPRSTGRRQRVGPIALAPVERTRSQHWPKGRRRLQREVFCSSWLLPSLPERIR
jgi:hypothetical protein